VTNHDNQEFIYLAMPRMAVVLVGRVS